MKKSEALKRWHELPENLNPATHFEPIPYKSEGRSFGACGIRIDGTPEFVDCVLSNLKQLLAAENCDTRLELTRKPVEPQPGKPCHKAVDRAEVCYVRCHTRGPQARRLNLAYGVV